jgi:hypothetical protein
MATILNRQVTFATNGTVTAAGLHNLIDQTEIYAGIITTQDQIASVGSSDQLLIADADETSTSAPRRVTVGSMFNDALNNGIYTTGSFTNRVTAGSFVGNLTGNVTGTIVGTTGTIATLNSTTGTIATLNSTTGTIATLNSTTGTITTLNSTTSTITNLAATTSTFLGTITGSTNIVNIGSGQIYKDASGNVGIGSTSPGGDSTNRVVNTFGSDSASFTATCGTVSVNYAATTGGGLLGTVNSSPLVFNINNTERLRIDSAGKVLIGSSTEKSSALSLSKLQIYDANLGLASNTDYLPQVTLYSASTTAAAAPYYITGRSRGSIESPSAVQSGDNLGSIAFGGHDGTAFRNNAAISYFVDGAVSSNNVPTAVLISTGTNGGSERFKISSAGVVTIANLAGAGSRAVNASAAGVLSAASDLSLKEVIAGEHIAGLSEILQINPRVYKWKEDIAIRGENATKELGFIANEVAPIIPSAAPMGNDGLYGFYDRSITAALVKAVQELKSENDSLKSRIEALETK